MLKRKAKQVVQEAKCKGHDNLYNKLGMKEGNKHIYKLVKRLRQVYDVICLEQAFVLGSPV